MAIYNKDGDEIGLGFISPENYGAVGNGIADDTSALQSAISNGGFVMLGTGKTYRTTDVIRIPKDTVIDLNGSTILADYKHLFYNFLSTDTSFTGYNGNGNICIKNGTIIGGAISFAHGENILLENVQFKNSLNDHFLEIAGCKNYKILNCSFVGMADVQTSVYEYINIDPCIYGNFPWMQNGSAFYDGTVNDGLFVKDCVFSLGSGTYGYGYNAIGVHSSGGVSSKHRHICIEHNEIDGFTGCGLRINLMQDVYINDNNIHTNGNGIVIGDVASCDEVVIKNNYVVCSGTKLVKSNYTNLTVVGNYTEGTIENF